MAETRKKKTDNSAGNSGEKSWQFQKGVSGNPGGRPKKSVKLKEMGAYAEEKLFELMKDPKTPLPMKVDIYKWVHDKAFGKATQAVDMETRGEILTSVRFEGKLDEWSE